MNKYTQYRKINESLMKIVEAIPLTYNIGVRKSTDRIRLILFKTYQALQDADNDKFFKKK